MDVVEGGGKRVIEGENPDSERTTMYLAGLVEWQDGVVVL
jgi:hypothetical protein